MRISPWPHDPSSPWKRGSRATRCMVRGVLLLATLLPLSTFADDTTSDDGYIGVDVGSDLYNQVDKGMYSLGTKIMRDRLTGSAKKINERMGKTCGDPPDYCLSDEDFTPDELDAIVHRNDMQALIQHFKPEYIREGITTTAFVTKAFANGKIFLDDVTREVSAEQGYMHAYGSLGLYTDGSIDNSSYDLLYDIELINKVLFEKPICYAGIVNETNSNLSDFGGLTSDSFGGFFQEIADDYTLDGSPSNRGDWSDTDTDTDSDSSSSRRDFTGSGDDQTYYPAHGVRVMSQGTASSCTGISVSTPASRDRILQSDITNQQTSRTNSRSSRGGTSGGTKKKSSGSLFDPTNCDSFFCITVRFITYDQDMMRYSGADTSTACKGGEDDSIETLIDKNLEIANHFAPSAMEGARMTRNSGEISQDMNLPDMLSQHVHVSRKPIPLGKSAPLATTDDPRSEAGASATPSDSTKSNGEQKGEAVTFDTIRKESLYSSFQARGMNYDHQNIIRGDCGDLALSQTDGLGVVDTASKEYPDPCNAARNTPESTHEALRTSTVDTYFSSLRADVKTLNGFTISFTKNIQSLIGVIRGMKEIPQMSN